MEVIIGLAVVWTAVRLAARRFERRRLREGAWNTSGPVDASITPPNPDLRGLGIKTPTIERDSN
jgi:hypothetical protein